ncbi:hypothetical protein D3C75_942860 [compost metagenome]
MPTAATPLSERPISARISRMPCQLVIKAQIRVQIAASSSATTITDLRPMASDSGPVNIRPIANSPVETDSDRLLSAGEMPKSCDRTGRIGCTQYSKAKVARPAENNAKVTRINCGVPRSM